MARVYGGSERTPSIDFSRMTAQEVEQLHTNDDLDSRPEAHHHSLGPGTNQAAPGSLVGRVDALDGGGESTGLGGLVHIRSVEFTAQTGVALDGIFTSDYWRYRIIGRTSDSAGSESTFQLRASGVNLYDGYVYQWRSTDIGASYIGGAWGAASWNLLGDAGPATRSFEVELDSPAEPVVTIGRATLGIYRFSDGGMWNRAASLYNFNNASYDGFLINSVKPITGHVQVYGYRKSL